MKLPFAFSVSTPLVVVATIAAVNASASTSVIADTLGSANVIKPALQMVSEDFAYYQQQIPGFYFFVGIKNEAKGITAMWHTEFYDMDEDALKVGVRAMSAAVLDYLAR